MKKFTDRVKNFFPALTSSMLPETNPASFDFIRTKGKMLQEFEYCLRHRNLVGVYCPLLGNGMFLAGVENILCGEDRSSMIIFFPYDMSGHRLARRSIELDEITMIVPFNNSYVSPAGLEIERITLAS